MISARIHVHRTVGALNQFAKKSHAQKITNLEVTEESITIVTDNIGNKLNLCKANPWPQLPYDHSGQDQI